MAVCCEEFNNQIKLQPALAERDSLLTSLNLLSRTGVGGASNDRLLRERKVLKDAIAVENLSGAVSFMKNKSLKVALRLLLAAS